MCGEHRLPACPFRQPAEKLFARSRPKSPERSLDCRRQAADDYRLAACAPQILAHCEPDIRRLKVPRWNALSSTRWESNAACRLIFAPSANPLSSSGAQASPPALRAVAITIHCSVRRSGPRWPRRSGWSRPRCRSRSWCNRRSRCSCRTRRCCCCWGRRGRRSRCRRCGNHRIGVSFAIVNAGSDDDATFANAECRRRSVHRQVPARVRRDQIGKAMGSDSIIKKRDRKSRRIVSDHPTVRVHRTR